MFIVRSGGVFGYEELVRSLGGNPIELIRQVGLSEVQFRDPNTYISHTKLANLLEITAKACQSPMFGLQLGYKQTSEVLGDLLMIMSQSATVGEAFANIEQALYLHANAVHINQHHRNDFTDIEVMFEFSCPDGLNQIIQIGVAQLANCMSELLNIEKSIISLCFRQKMPKAKFLSTICNKHARIHFDAKYDCIRIPTKWLDRKPCVDERVVQLHVESHLLQLQQSYPSNLHDSIKNVITTLLPSGECSIDRVAATLDLHVRVLQKKLKKTGLSYGQILMETRKEIAEKHLREQSMGITDLALHLGYVDISVFSRNFKTWTGMSPRLWMSHKNKNS